MNRKTILTGKALAALGLLLPCSFVASAPMHAAVAGIEQSSSYKITGKVKDAAGESIKVSSVPVFLKKELQTELLPTWTVTLH